MIEIFSIIYQFLIFLLIFSFPFKVKNLETILILKRNRINIIDAHIINIIFFIYICLIASFLNLNLEIFFKTYVSIALLFLIYNFRKYNLKSLLDILKNLYFIIFCILVISIFFSIAQNLKLEWDGHHWLEKVLVFFNNGNISDLQNVSVHPEYPHMGSYLWAFFWKNSITETEYLGRFFYVYFYMTSIFLLLNVLNFQSSKLKILIILSFTLLTYDSYLFGGYQEYLIFSTLIVASRYIFLTDFNKTKNTKLVFLSILILYLASWFKDEGLIYFFIFSILLIFFQNINNANKFRYIVFIFSLILIQYLLQKYLIGIYDFPQKSNITNIISDILNFKILFFKISNIFIFTLMAFVKYPLWLVVLLSIVLSLFLVKKNKELTYLISCFILNMCFIFAAFFSFVGFDFMLRVSLDRLLFQTSGFYIISLSILINHLKIKKII